jgi:hypothetical protein
MITTITIGYHGYGNLIVTTVLFSSYNIISIVIVMVFYMK